MLAFFLHFVTLLALSLWVGAGAGIGFLAAPALFQSVPSRREAGVLVGEILRRFEKAALGLGAAAALCILLQWVGTHGASRTLSLQLALVLAMLALVLYSKLAVAPEVRRLRDQLQGLPPEAEGEVRRRFGRMHGLSVLCLLAEILFGAFAMGLGVMLLWGRPGGC